MIETTLCIAGVTVCVAHQYEYITRLCADYVSQMEPQLYISVTQEDIQAEKVGPVLDFTEGYLEGLAFFRKFCNAIATRGLILFHCCAIEVDGKAYLFSAPSGTGKSTHGRLWLELLGDRAMVLNGDKPLVGITDGQPTVYGTPNRGKEGWGYNGSAPIGGICFIRRGEINRIASITPEEAFPEAYAQTIIPRTTEQATAAVDILAKMLGRVPIYRLECNISQEAAKLSYQTMTGDIL